MIWAFLLLVAAGVVQGTECTLAGALTTFRTRINVTSPVIPVENIDEFMTAQKTNGCLSTAYTFTGANVMAYCDMNMDGQLTDVDLLHKNGCILGRYNGVLPTICRVLACGITGKK